MCYYWFMSLSEKIIKSLEISSDLLLEIDGLKYLPYRMMWGIDLQGYRRRSVQSILSRLVKDGLVKKRRNQVQVYLALTQLASNFTAKKKRQTRLSLTSSAKGWDGLYRVVIFDIPERDRFLRDALRMALKDIRAVQWQRSVWVTKEAVTGELNDFFGANNLEDYCSVLEVKDVYNLKMKKLLEEG